ncbi:MAG: hypothetical protein ACREE4_23570 [Stellaceae bacterium]
MEPLWSIRPVIRASAPRGAAAAGAANAPKGPSERRERARRRVLKSALIVFRGGHCTMGCQILNTSDTGALVMPADVILCPNEFVLKPQIGPARDCEVVWRKGTTLGVRYL